LDRKPQVGGVQIGDQLAAQILEPYFFRISSTFVVAEFVGRIGRVSGANRGSVPAIDRSQSVADKDNRAFSE
jgi:hypothetical protein